MLDDPYAKKLWMICLLVSVVLAALMPIVASIVVVPEEGEDVHNMASIDAKQFETCLLMSFVSMFNLFRKRRLREQRDLHIHLLTPGGWHDYFSAWTKRYVSKEIWNDIKWEFTDPEFNAQVELALSR